MGRGDLYGQQEQEDRKKMRAPVGESAGDPPIDRGLWSARMPPSAAHAGDVGGA